MQEDDLALYQLVLLTAVNKIIQTAGCIAISSATSGGQPNDLEHHGMIELATMLLFILLTSG